MRLSIASFFAGLIGPGLVLAPTLQAQAAPEVSATATTDATTLDLDGTGSSSTHIVKVADISISTTNSTGLELVIPNGYLTEEENRTIAFQVTTVPDNSASPDASAFISGDYTYSTGLSGAEARDVYIKYTTSTVADPGNYSANIQFTVSDNL